MSGYPICLGCGLPGVGGIVGVGACVGAGRAGAGVTGLFLTEAEDVEHVEVVRAHRILEVVGGLILGLVCRLIRIVRVNRRLMEGQHLSLQEEKTFVEEMVNSPQLYEYLKDASDDYALYVFIPYMFGTTYYGMQACPEKSVLIPCFHDEAYLYLRLFRQAYIQARGIIYNAMPEMELANKVYDFTTTEQICMGIGMDTNICANADAFRKAYRIQKPFLLYAGRKDAGKNVHTLLRYFAEYKQRHGDSDLQLVLIGGGSIEIPASVRDDVYDLGFVSRQDKYDAMAAAELLCQPSHNCLLYTSPSPRD